MAKCAVATCSNYYRKTIGKSVIYHVVPKNSVLAKEWLSKCRISDCVNIQNASVCSDHFKPCDYVDDLKNRLLGLKEKKTLKPDAIPSRNLPSSDQGETSDRISRKRKRDVLKEASSRIAAFSPKKKYLMNRVEIVEDIGGSEMDKEDLIAKVRHRPCIWDKRLKEYSMRHKVDEGWREIAGLTVGYNERELRKKWKHLRDQFSVELKKSAQNPDGEVSAAPSSKWTHFESMLFLKDVLNPRPHSRKSKRKTISPPPVKDEAQTTEDDEGQETEEDLSNSSVAAPKLFSLLKRRRDANETVAEVEKKKTAKSTEDASESFNSDDDDVLFFRSLLPYVGIIPTHLKLKFRNRIQQIVDEFAFPKPNRTDQPESSFPTSSHSTCNSPSL